MSECDQPGPLRAFRRHAHLARHDEPIDRIYRIEDGWACQYRLLADGRRQIVALFLPGDYCQPQWLLCGRATLPVVALTSMRVREISIASIRARAPHATDGMASVLDAMLLVLNSHERWIVNLGRMTATERICRFFVEMFERLQAGGLVECNRCPMPLTQSDLADILGITPIHVNRVLQTLRGDGVIELGARSLALLDPGALEQLSGPVLHQLTN